LALEEGTVIDAKKIAAAFEVFLKTSDIEAAVLLVPQAEGLELLSSTDPNSEWRGFIQGIGPTLVRLNICPHCGKIHDRETLH
jgi:hypothetical protein